MTDDETSSSTRAVLRCQRSKYHGLTGDELRERNERLQEQADIAEALE
jgi:hypothetical protein